MAHDFHDYIADLVTSAQERRNLGSPASAAMLDDQLLFAVSDAARVGLVGNLDSFRNEVSQRVIKRSGSKLFDILTPHKP